MSITVKTNFYSFLPPFDLSAAASTKLLMNFCPLKLKKTPEKVGYI